MQDPAGPVQPGAHSAMQSEGEVLPSAETESLGQLEQVAAPTDSLYLPTVQLVHGPPSGPLEPALHVHALLLVLPEGEVERDGQLVQVSEPVLILYVPATHAVHVYVSMSLLEPGGQSNCLEEHRRRERAQTQRERARARSSERSRERERKSQRAGNFTFALPVNFLFFAPGMSTHTCKHAHAHAKRARKGHRRHSTPDHHNSERSKAREGRACACALPRTCPSARSRPTGPQCGLE